MKNFNHNGMLLEAWNKVKGGKCYAIRCYYGVWGFEIYQTLFNKWQNEEQLKKWLKQLFRENANEILSELAYDLDFYEPNKKHRKENPGYYGNDRLEVVVKTTIQKLQEQSP